MKDGESLLQRGENVIKMADRSELGWRIISQYEADELADHSDKEKRLEKAAERKLGRRRKAVLTQGSPTAGALATEAYQPHPQQSSSHSQSAGYIHLLPGSKAARAATTQLWYPSGNVPHSGMAVVTAPTGFASRAQLVVGVGSKVTPEVSAPRRFIPGPGAGLGDRVSRSDWYNPGPAG